MKAMERRWAEALLEEGAIRFGSLGSYQQWENAVLGDPDDGEGMFRVDGHSYDTGSINPVYAWCTSLADLTPARTRQLASGVYNCVLRVHDPARLIQRIRASLAEECRTLHLHCGEVSYSRGTELDKKSLNSQNFHFNVFQKNSRFSPDREYRMALTDVSLPPESTQAVDLKVGNCSDIMSIEGLPA